MSNEKIKSNKNKQTLQEKYEILLKEKNSLQNKCRQLETENIILKALQPKNEILLTQENSLQNKCRQLEKENVNLHQSLRMAIWEAEHQRDIDVYKMDVDVYENDIYDQQKRFLEELEKPYKAANNKPKSKGFSFTKTLLVIVGVGVLLHFMEKHK